MSNRSRRTVKKLLRRASRAGVSWNADYVRTPDNRLVTMWESFEHGLIVDYASAAMR